MIVAGDMIESHFALALGASTMFCAALGNAFCTPMCVHAYSHVDYIYAEIGYIIYTVFVM